MKIHNYDTELDELKDCPFCGSRPIAYLVGNEHWVSLKKIPKIIIQCKNCLVTMHNSSLESLETLEKISIQNWNRREV